MESSGRSIEWGIAGDPSLPSLLTKSPSLPHIQEGRKEEKEGRKKGRNEGRKEGY
jgi:hypothetical protein